MNKQLREREPRAIVEVNSRSLLETALFSLSFRMPMPVSELMEFPSDWGTTTYYICPRCDITLEREYQSFCDRCGQHLNWRGCEYATIVRAPRKNNSSRTAHSK